ncbi:MAG: tetratricopeptide repeat protein [bacterium]|nr:tetratricopeptide repeat protein [bacterium]
MKTIIFIVVGLLVFGSCSVRGHQSEFRFANKLAEKGLWKEAYVRWQKIIDGGKETAALYNNVAIALERMGKTAEAEAAYNKALKLSPGNSRIKSNLERMKKFGKEDEPGKKKKKGKKKGVK